MIDDFFQEYQYTFAAIGSIGSMGAVIVSLWYSYAENSRKCLKCTLKMNYDRTIHGISVKRYYVLLLDILNNSFFDVKINMTIGIKYGRGRNVIQMLPEAFVTPIAEYQLTTSIITLNRGESKSIVFAHDDTSSNLVKNFNNDITKAKNEFAKRSFFGRFGNKLYLELSDGTKIKIDNRIPKHVPN